MLCYAEAARQGEERLAAAGIEEARPDARRLLEAVCKSGRQELYLRPDRVLDEEEAGEYERLLRRRESREPLQYILGEQYFYGLRFHTAPGVLIPRADTEVLVERVLADGAEDKRVLDLCTGSGCILMAVLKNAPGSSGTGTDLSEEALKIALENINMHHMSANLYHGDLYEALNGSNEGRFDILVSNPPYICSGEIDALQPEVAGYEPRMALDGGSDGLFFYRRIAEGAAQWLVIGGRIYLEIGHTQAEAVRAILAEKAFFDIECIKDYAGMDRVVCASYKR